MMLSLQPVCIWPVDRRKFLDHSKVNIVDNSDLAHYLMCYILNFNKSCCKYRDLCCLATFKEGDWSVL